MKIKIINPNTTQSMTDSIYSMAARYADPGTEIIVVSPKTGPDSIECYVDEYLAVPGVIQEVIKGDREEGADAFIIACFGDPGLAAAREVTDKPVLGICESARRHSKVHRSVFQRGVCAGSVQKGDRRRGQSLWRGKLLPVHTNHGPFCSGFWKRSGERPVRSGGTGQKSREGRRRGMHPAGLRRLCGLCRRPERRTGRTSSGWCHACREAGGSLGEDGCKDQQGEYMEGAGTERI